LQEFSLQYPPYLTADDAHRITDVIIKEKTEKSNAFQSKDTQELGLFLRIFVQ